MIDYVVILICFRASYCCFMSGHHLRFPRGDRLSHHIPNMYEEVSAAPDLFTYLKYSVKHFNNSHDMMNDDSIMNTIYRRQLLC